MWIKKNALRDKNGEGCGGWPPDATCLNNWCLQLFFLQRSVLIWIKLKITYVIKCEELRIVAANLARYRPNWIFDVFISMKSVKLLLFSFIEWISNLLFFCVIELSVILNCLNHISQTWDVAKTCVCGGGGGGHPLHRLASLVTRISSRDHRTREHQQGKKANIAYMLWTTWIWCVILARVTLNFSTEEPSISCKSNFTEYPPF